MVGLPLLRKAFYTATHSNGRYPALAPVRSLNFVITPTSLHASYSKELLTSCCVHALGICVYVLPTNILEETTATHVRNIRRRQAIERLLVTATR